MEYPDSLSPVLFFFLLIENVCTSVEQQASFYP